MEKQESSDLYAGISFKRKDVNDLHDEFGQSFRSNHCSGQSKKAAVNEKAVSQLTMNEERLFIDISSPVSDNLSIERHWLLIIEDSISYA